MPRNIHHCLDGLFLGFLKILVTFSSWVCGEDQWDTVGSVHTFSLASTSVLADLP